jgi:hypothetical protein
MPISQCLCTYKSAKRGLFFINIFNVIFAIALCVVGGLSLSYGKYFADRSEAYCVQQCAGQSNVVGCDCTGSNGGSPASNLPFYFYLAPSIGVTTIGVLALVTAILGIVGGLRKDDKMLLAYIIIMSIIILIQFSFACAAAVVASGNAGSVSKQLEDSLSEYYTRFDWSFFQNVLPSACYIGKTTVTVPISPGVFESETYLHPLCKFYGECVTINPTKAERQCCNAFYLCDISRPQCISGSACILSMLSLIGAPVAAVAFCGLVVEVMAAFCACVVRQGRGSGGGGGGGGGGGRDRNDSLLDTFN